MNIGFLHLCCLAWLTTSALSQLSSMKQVTGEFGKRYSDKAQKNVNYLIVYNFIEKVNTTQAVRIHASSSAALRNYPVLFVVRQQRSILSFQIPENMEGEHYYGSVARTLCPVENVSKGKHDKNQTIYVDISSASELPVPFTVNMTIVEGFNVQLGERKFESVTPSTPKYFMFRFPPNVWQVSIRIESVDNYCMIVSTQSTTCPVYDLVRNVEFTGEYQTMISKAEMTLQKRNFEDSVIYIVFVLKPSTEHCNFKRMKDLQPKMPVDYDVYNNKGLAKKDANVSEITQPTDAEKITKYFEFVVYSSLQTQGYFLPVFGAIGFFSCFYLVTAIVVLVQQRLEKDTLKSCLGQSESTEKLNAQSDEAAVCPTDIYGSTQNHTPEGNNISMRATRIDNDYDDETVESDEAIEDGNASDNFPKQLHVSDLCRKKRQILNNKYRLYYWYLIIISIFYGLPVIQLVITYQQILHISGNQDICYYNFYCAHPLGVISAFNNVFSNVGYVMLGVLFLGLTWRRDYMNKRYMAIRNGDSQTGIPQHFGIFYALAVALVMEGILSGCYHVCPSYSNFQFDTAYMYILSGLCMLKIYQIRHPDINASAHVSYMGLAIVILVSVIGVVYGTTLFWGLFTLVFILSSIFLTGEIYYMGHWKVSVGFIRRFYIMASSEGIKCFRPMYKDRMILLLVVNFVNWSLALYGVISKPTSFNSFLLSIFLINLLMYCAFYITMKLRNGEKILWIPMVFTLLACVSWVAALYFFCLHAATWEKSPAESRELNQNCMIFDFYDVHDIWHFLSATSLFFSFMALLSLDDDLVNIPRDKIPVF